MISAFFEKKATVTNNNMYGPRRNGLAVVLVIVLLHSSCQMKDGLPPIPKDTMRAVLLDLNMAESYSTMVKDTLRGTATKNPDSLATYYQTIFKHYGISRDDFDKSMAWYKTRPNEMDSLFSGIIPLATRLQAHTDSVQQATRQQAANAPAKP